MQETNIFLQAQREKQIKVCRIAQIINSLDSQKAIQLTEALEAADRISNKTLSETLRTKWDIIISNDSIGKHRRKACSCYA